MEQRRLRLGDILDDYCPRERRVTNHAVVAMIEDDVKQTRCTTCDAEHAYKGGREPRRRKKNEAAVLYREVLAGLPEVEPVGAGAAVAGEAAEEPPPALVAVPSNGNGSNIADLHESDDAVIEPSTAPGADLSDEGPIHRRLIRATLPRPEGQKTERPLPEFTIRGNGSVRGDRMKTRGHGGGKGGRRFQKPGFGANHREPGGPGRGSGRNRRRPR